MSANTKCGDVFIAEEVQLLPTAGNHWSLVHSGVTQWYTKFQSLVAYMMCIQQWTGSVNLSSVDLMFYELTHHQCNRTSRWRWFESRSICQKLLGIHFYELVRKDCPNFLITWSSLRSMLVATKACSACYPWEIQVVMHSFFIAEPQDHGTTLRVFFMYMNCNDDDSILVPTRFSNLLSRGKMIRWHQNERLW